METSGVGVEAVIREFRDHRFDRDFDGFHLAAADEDHFEVLTRGVVERQQEIDRAVSRRLGRNWRLDRVDATARAILRVGTFEILHCPQTPREVALDEYVEIAKSFFDSPETGFVNATLDGIARDAPAA